MSRITDYGRLLLFIPMRVLYWVFMPFHIKKSKVVFNNFNGRGYGCHPKYICEELRRQNQNLDLVWLTKNRQSLPKDVRNVDIKSFRALWEMATAKVWVCNNRLPFYIAKKKNQFYIQTWHGYLGFKVIESDIKNQPIYYKIRSIHDSKMIDILNVNSQIVANYFKKCFFYNGTITEFGSPRNDLIANRDSIPYKKVRDFYNLSLETKILIYAPTFRRNQDLSIYKLPFHRIIEALQKRFGGNWVTLVRLHPVVAHHSNNILKYEDTIINASNYDDIQELLAASDFMINDFSSCIFDFIIGGKPALTYASDYDVFVKEGQDPLNISQILPFPVTKNEQEMIDCIEHFEDIQEYLIKLHSFESLVGMHEDGNASKNIAEIIIEKTK